MKNFLRNNWYKLITATSILLISLSCFLYSISNLIATPNTKAKSNSNLHVNTDGSINVNLSDDQIRRISKNNEIQKVDIVKFRGEKWVKSDYHNFLTGEKVGVMPTIIVYKNKAE